jgi:hypothetical protein
MDAVARRQCVKVNGESKSSEVGSEWGDFLIKH